MKVSGTTAAFCNPQTKLIPQLIVTAPSPIAVEFAHLSFNYYTPNSIYGTKWVYREDCHDLEVGMEKDYEYLEDTFPGIDQSEKNVEMKDGDFLTWLSQRSENIIAVSSTPSWVEKFCNGAAGVHFDARGTLSKSAHLRAVGIKFY